METALHTAADNLAIIHADRRKRILFVDDEALLLDGLRARLHTFRHKWAMTFATSGTQALTELQRQPFDVLVSDIRMCGMDGPSLLRTVSERWPQVVRVVLSGCADREEATRLAPIAHQFLSKPCEPRRLEEVIDQSLLLHDLLRTRSLRTLVGRIRRLPPSRKTYAKLQTLMADDTASTQEVAQVIANDAVIAAKVLQMVNSAFFCLGRRVTNIQQAVNYLGFTAIRALTISAEIFAQWPNRAAHGIINLELLQHHTQEVVGVVRTLPAVDAVMEDALLAALLHDIGYWILAHECPAELARACHYAIERGMPMHEAERQTLGASHAEIGAYLLGLWGLPSPVVTAVAHHHTPEHAHSERFDVLGALAVGHALASMDDAFVFQHKPHPDRPVAENYLESLAAPFTWNEALERSATRMEYVQRAS